MSSIEKLIDILSEKKYLDNTKVLEQLDELLKKLDSPKNYTNELLNELISVLIPGEQLNDTDLEFLRNFSILTDPAKEYLLKESLKDSEIKIFEEVKSKVLSSKKFYEKIKNQKVDVDDLIRKLNGKKKIITRQELEFILDVIKDALNEKEQIELLKEINKINFNTYKNYVSSLSDVEEISEEDLEETNINSNDVENLLLSYGINYSEFENEYKQKLSKFGNLDKMKSILEFLKQEEIIGGNIKLYPEIITRTLLYSSVEELIKVKKANNIDFKELVRKIPTVLYPSIRTKTIRKQKASGGSEDLTSTGLMKNYLKNSELLAKYNIPFDVIWDRCYTFFKQSYKANKDSIECLQLYGISLYDENNNIRDIFSVLGYRNPSIIDIFDLALEADAKEYALKNPSSISSYQRFKFYLIKLARKIGLTNNEIFGNYTKPEKELFLRTKTLLQDKRLSKNIDELFKSYGAVDINIPNKSVYDNLFDITNINKISSEILNDANIKALENFKESDEIYNFNGTRISRKKVLRYYTTLKNNDKAIDMSGIMYCIIHGSMLDEEEFDNIYSLVKSVVNFEFDDDIKVISKKYADLETNEKNNKVSIIGGSKND